MDYNYKDGNNAVINKQIESCAVPTLVRSTPEISITKVSSPRYLAPGERLTISLIATNNTVNEMESVIIEDIIDSNLTYLGDARLTMNNVNITIPTNPQTGDPTLVYAGNTLTLNTGTTNKLNSEEKAILTFSALVDNTLDPPVHIRNTGTVYHIDKDHLVDTSEETISSLSYAQLGIEKSVVDEANQAITEVQCDTNFYYKVVISNTGDLDATFNYTDGANPSYGFTDTFPLNFNFASAANFTDDVIIGAANNPTDTNNHTLTDLMTTDDVKAEAQQQTGTTNALLKIGNMTIPGKSTRYIFIKGKFPCATP